MTRQRRRCFITLVVALIVPLACESNDPPSSSADTADTADTSGSSGSSGDQSLDIVASFYPLQFVVEQIGGDRVDVSNLTPTGAEPHDLELTGADTAGLQDAQLVVYLGGFSPALDDAIANVSSSNAFDVADVARLDLLRAAEQQDGQRDGVDPHFWLDPIRLADVGDAIAAELTTIDPDGAATYEQNSASLRTRLEALDEEYNDGLADCASRDLVTSHAAFGYLAQRYRLTQIGVSGLLPEQEPSPGDIADVTEFVREHRVNTIYYETLVDPAVAETVASETGASTAVLDPIEGLSSDSQGTDYLEIMRSNLSNLRSGQGCS
ncbi:MAG: metal ABC transporter substrate-binding protein [Ilumatobacteraceae bacterium]